MKRFRIQVHQIANALPNTNEIGKQLKVDADLMAAHYHAAGCTAFLDTTELEVRETVRALDAIVTGLQKIASDPSVKKDRSLGLLFREAEDLSDNLYAELNWLIEAQDREKKFAQEYDEKNRRK